MVRSTQATFEKRFGGSRFSENAIIQCLIYQYRGNPNSVRTDGTLNPYPYNATNPVSRESIMSFKPL